MQNAQCTMLRRGCYALAKSATFAKGISRAMPNSPPLAMLFKIKHYFPFLMFFRQDLTAILGFFRNGRIRELIGI